MDVGELVRYSASSAVPDGISVSVSAPDDLPRVIGHHDALAGAISNVVLNAADACNGNGRIDIRASRTRLRDKEAVAIDISDNGSGIAAADL